MTFAWRIRRATAGDAPACALVASASFLAAFYDDLSTADMVAHCAHANAPETFAGWIASPECAVTLAEYEATGCPVGYSALTPPDLPVATDGGDVELKRIYMLPAGYGTGLAAALMDQAIMDASALGKRRMLLGVYGGNRRAQRFYEKMGFAAIGERRFLVGATWHDDLVYSISV